MMPIQDLLHRIQWDQNFGRAEFTIGYFDRIEHEIILVPLKEIEFPGDNPGMFELVDYTGQSHSIPLHRVRAVYRNGELIWRRKLSQPD